MTDDGTIELDLTPEDTEQEETLEEQCRRMKALLREASERIDAILEIVRDL